MQNAKKDLYRYIDLMRYNLQFPLHAHPLNLIELCERSPKTEVRYHEFSTFGFCGAALAGEYSDTIVLNSRRSFGEMNFDCGHEIIHLARHRNRNDGVFNCFSGCQNSFIEWEANEGAAQLLVPYQDFIPRFLQLLTQNKQSCFYTPCEQLAKYYNVSTQVINLRIDNLSYEIDQYRAGVPMDQIHLLSRSQQQRLGIHPTTYSTVIDFSTLGHALSWDSMMG